MSNNMFDFSYINSENKFNNLYSTYQSLAEAVQLEDLPREEYVLNTRTSRTRVFGRDVTRNNIIKDVMAEAMNQLNKCEQLNGYEINFKSKRAIVVLKPNIESVNVVKFKGVLNHERKTLWFDIILDSQSLDLQSSELS